MGEEVSERIRAAVLDHGPITFAEFMEHALYGPGGFYETPPVGTHRHFVTSPHVHPVFARLIGVGLEILHGALGRPEPFRIVEAGAGDGTMAAELLAGFARAGLAVDYEAVEVSPGARDALHRLHVRAHERLASVGPIDRGVILANELLDNLPFRVVLGGRGGPVEVRIGLEADRFVEVPAPCPPELLEITGEIGEGVERVVPVGALGFVDQVASVLGSGYVLFIDYGREGAQGRAVRGYRNHRVLADVLEHVGSADVTAEVDLGAVTRRARDRGLVAFEPVSQRAALTALGYEAWSRAELERQGELLSSGRGRDAVRAWGDRSRASLLVDPSGLGDLSWLVLATPGLPPPAWLVRATKGRMDDRQDPPVQGSV